MNKQVEILTVKETAELLKVDISTIYDRLHYPDKSCKKFPHFHIGKSIRIPKKDLYKYLNITYTNSRASVETASLGEPK